MSDLNSILVRANELYGLGMFGEAALACESVLAKAPRHLQALHLLAFVRAKSGRHEDAVRLMKQVVRLKPGNAEALYHQGCFELGQGLRADAIASFERALASNPKLVEAHIDRGNALQELDRFDDALASYDRALAIDKNQHHARRNRFVCNLRQIRDIDSTVAEGLAVARANLQERFARAQAAGLNGSISAFRLKHDLEQCRYLVANGGDFAGLKEALSTFEALDAKRPGSGQAAGSGSLPLSASEMAAIERFRRSLQVYRQPERIEHYLNEGNDWAGIERRYFSSSPEIVQIDDLLSAEALAALRRFCLASTIWKTEYANQYLGAFFDEGFISDLHMRVARELQLKMPGIFGGHTLEECWAFKYDSSMRKGIGVHADFAKVNLNFWITADEANLGPESGGLVVYDKPAPKSWQPADYNGATEKIYQFLAEQRATAITVPYRCNRAVLFNSSLFHETDSLRFKEGYENRRINVTYLFGKELQRSA